MSAVTYQRDTQARGLHRTLSVIALQAREKALEDGMTCDGMQALRGIAEGIKAIASHAGTICHADAGDELGALSDHLSDMCAKIVEAHLTPQFTAACRADARSKAMREDAA